MLVPVLLFALGLLLLIKGGDWFVDGATGFARRFRVPELLIGATIVSLGTTLPEVMVSATSAMGGHGEIAYGNAVGSIICNTSLIAAITMTVRPCPVDKKAMRQPVIFFFATAVFYLAVSYAFGRYSRLTGFLLMGIFILYTVLSVRQARREPTEECEDSAFKEEPVWKNSAQLIVGAICIAYGADLLVDNGTLIAKALGVPESVIGLTFVALGTSLPELVTAITSLAKGHGALSLGNIIGANLFNMVIVTGISAALSPFTVPDGMKILGISSALLVELPLMVTVMAILCFPALKRGKVTRTQGITLLCIYAAFCAFQFTCS